MRWKKRGQVGEKEIAGGHVQSRRTKWTLKAVIFGFTDIPNPAFLGEKNHSLALLQNCTHFGGLLAPVLYKIIKKKLGNSVNHNITVLSAHN